MASRFSYIAKKLGGVLAFLSLTLAFLSYTSYQVDNRFFSSLAEISLEGTPVHNKQNLCLQLLDFSSKIPISTCLPASQIPSWVRLYYKFSPFKPDPRSVVRYGTDHRGPCGSRSRVLAALLESQEIPVRLTALHAEGEAVHTIVEAKCGPKWVVLDPTYNLFFLDRNGGLMSVEEIQKKPDLFRETAKDKRGTGVCFPSYYPIDDYTYEDVYPFNWNAFGHVLPMIKGTLDKVIPMEENKSLFHWPYSYRRPKLFLAQIAFGLGLFLLALRFLVK